MRDFNHTSNSISAIYSPKNIETLRVSYLEHTGKRLKFDYAWHQDKGDPYPGQPVFIEKRDGNQVTDGHWVPLEDLRDVKELSG